MKKGRVSARAGSKLTVLRYRGLARPRESKLLASYTTFARDKLIRFPRTGHSVQSRQGAPDARKLEHHKY